MTYVVKYTTTIPVGQVFYNDSSEQGFIDSNILTDFRKIQPGYVGEVLETPTPTTRILTVTFENQGTYDAYMSSIRQLPEFTRREAYLDTMDVNASHEINPASTPT
jgi:hypothetical protein